jgi:NAD(P)-dependent dehydrogenase (short-subunit alcohol dehydrogenase family)
MSSKVALVTGAGKRIGQAIAIQLAELGYDIAVHYSSSADGAQTTKSKVELIGQKAFVVQADLAEAYAPKELIETVIQVFGRLDLLVNSASTYPEPDKIESKHTFEKESEEEWEEAIAVNTRAPFFLIKYASPFLKKSENGIVINILDRSVDEMMTSRAAHTISKNGLKNITDFGAKSFGDSFKVCALLLGRIIPGDKMSPEEAAEIKWVGLGPVLDKVKEIISTGATGKTYVVK